MSDLAKKLADAAVQAIATKCPVATGDRAREVAEEAIRQSLGSTQERGEAVERRSFVEWRRVEDGLPDSSVWNKVLVYTDGVDFGGEQFFHIRAQSLYPSDGDYDNEIAEAATHWSPAPFPSASAAPADAQRVAELDEPVANCDALADMPHEMLLALAIAQREELQEVHQQLTESREREGRMREALEHYEDALLAECPEGATGATFISWNKARAALAAEKGEK